MISSKVIELLQPLVENLLKLINDLRKDKTVDEDLK